MKKVGRGNKVPRKILICQYCSKEFTVEYIGMNSKKTVKTCKECIHIVKKEAALVQNNGGTDLSELFDRATLFLTSKPMSLTFADLCGELKCSSKTLFKALKEKDLTYNELLSSLDIPISGISKFQQKVLVSLHEIYPNFEIVSEKRFDDLVNPKTGHKLRFDMFIPYLNTVIECDGLQHTDDDHYFNKLTVKNGHTTSIETDKIKNTYCLENNIRIVRIPYKKRVTKTFIYSLVK